MKSICESAWLMSTGTPQSVIRLAFFPISSTEHNMFVCDLFWKWDPFVLTDACSGAVAKAQLDFLDCHARLVIYPLLSDKQNCSFVTLRNNYFPRRHTTLNLFCLEPDTDMAVRQEVGWSVNRKCSSVILINPDARNICWINVKDSGRHSCCKLQFTRLSSCDQQNFSATNEDSCEVTQQLLIIYLRIRSLLSILLGRVFIPGQRDLRPHWPSHGHFFEISRSEG